MAEKTPLTAAQRRAAEILATNDIHQMKIEEIAAEVGVSERTIYRWKRDPAFIEYQNKIAEEVMTEFIAEAYTQLRRLVRSGESDNIKLKAVELTLKNRGKLRDVQDQNVKIQDDRSNEAIKADIERLKAELERVDRAN
jgi:AcrR family transcriptional regulator